MSGFGSGKVEREGYEVSVEIKTVNHRYLDFNIRMPRNLGKFEDDVRKTVSKRLSRGRVDLYINFANRHTGMQNVVLNETLLDAYLERLHEMAESRKVKDDISVMTLARLPELLTVEEEHEDEEFLRRLLLDAVEEAANGLVKMREAEGRTLCEDMDSRLDTLLAITETVDKRSGAVVEEYREKLKTRITELLKEVALDDAKLANEVAFYADRSSINEEVVRLKSHVQQMRKMMKEKEPQGRKLDFLIQELNREVNTIGSKSADIDIARAVIDAKAEIEKLREQVQNLE